MLELLGWKSHATVGEDVLERRLQFLRSRAAWLHLMLSIGCDSTITSRRSRLRGNADGSSSTHPDSEAVRQWRRNHERQRTPARVAGTAALDGRSRVRLSQAAPRSLQHSGHFRRTWCSHRRANGLELVARGRGSAQSRWGFWSLRSSTRMVSAREASAS